MEKKGFSVFYVIMSMLIVIIVGFMLMKFMFLKSEQLCTYEDQGTCCISIMDKCEAQSGTCVVGACEETDCQDECGNETYCTLYPPLTGDPAIDGSKLHACISEDCLGDVSKCSPVECTMAAFKYDPKNDIGINNGKDWWLVLDTAKDKMCCQVNEEIGGLVKTCNNALQ